MKKVVKGIKIFLIPIDRSRYVGGLEDFIKLLNEDIFKGM